MSSSPYPAAVTERAVSSVLELIGHTPLIRLQQFERETPGRGAVREGRMAQSGRIGEGPRRGAHDSRGRKIRAHAPGLTLVDATSGNTGIAYSMIGAAKGYKVKLFLPENASPERKLILRAFGAELVLTSPLEGTDGSIRAVRQLVAEHPELVFLSRTSTATTPTGAHTSTQPAPRSSSRPAGVSPTSSPGLGTSGTFMGTSRALRQFNPNVKVMSFQPDSPFHGLEGLKHMETAMVPAIYDAAMADADVRVSTEEAHRCVRRLAREAGLMVGISSGAALAATLQVARTLDRGVVVTVFPDGAEKYLTESFWTAD